MMDIRSHPASFSKSLRMVIWKHTDTRQCRILSKNINVSLKYKYKVISKHFRKCSQMSHLPSMQEERQPQAIELIWDLWVEKWQQATHIIHAVHLIKRMIKTTATSLTST